MAINVSVQYKGGLLPGIIPLTQCYFFFFFFNLTYSRWTSSLPSCLWSLRIFPSLPGSRLTIFYRDASSALLQLVNQWLNFTYSRTHAFRYEIKNTNTSLVRIELTTFALAGRCAGYLPLGNPFQCHDKLFFLQPMILPKRFDVFPPLTEGCSEGLDEFRYFYTSCKTRPTLHGTEKTRP